MSFYYITMVLIKDRNEETMKDKTILENSTSKIKSTVITPQPISVKSGEALEKYEACYFYTLYWSYDVKISSDGSYLITKDDDNIHIWDIEKERIVKIFQNSDNLSQEEQIFLKSFDTEKNSSDILIEISEYDYYMYMDVVEIVDKTNKRWKHAFYLPDSDGYINLSEKNDKHLRYIGMSSDMIGKIYVRALSSLTPTVLKEEKSSNYIYSKSYKESLDIWNREKQRLKYVDSLHANYISSIDISQDGRYMVSGASSSYRDAYICLNLWDLETGLLITSFEDARDVQSVCISPDNSYIVVGAGPDGDEASSYIQIWDIKSARLIYSICDEDNLIDVEFIGISLDGKSIVAQEYSSNKNKQVWDITHIKEFKDLKGNAEEVKALALSPDGRYIISVLVSNTVQVWDKESHQLVESFLVEDSSTYYILSAIEHIAMSSDNQYIGLKSHERVTLWDREEQKIYTEHTAIKSFDFVENKSENYSLIVLEDVIKLEKISGESIVIESLSGKELRVIKAILSPNEMYVVVGTGDGKILVWDIKKEKVLQTIEAHKEEIINALVTTSDGKEVISGSTDGTIRVWNINDNTLKQEYIGGQRGNWFVRDFEAKKVYKGDDGDFLFEKKEIYRNGDSVVFEVDNFFREE